MKEVKAIEVIFENCESFKIKKHLLLAFDIGDIHTHICRYACNFIGRYQLAGRVVLEISKEIEKEDYHLFGMDSKFEKSGKYKRLCNYNDITHVNVIYDDDSTEEFSVNYHEEQEGILGAENINQKTVVGKNGNIYIVIEEGSEISDYFDEEYMSQTSHSDMEPEEFSWEEEGIPCLFRYFYGYKGLPSSADYKSNIMVRIPDGEGWKLLSYDDEAKEVYEVDYIPDIWSYPSLPTEAITSHDYENTAFSLKILVAKYAGDDSEMIAKVSDRFDKMAAEGKALDESFYETLQDFLDEYNKDGLKKVISDAGEELVATVQPMLKEAKEKVKNAGEAVNNMLKDERVQKAKAASVKFLHASKAAAKQALKAAKEELQAQEKEDK